MLINTLQLQGFKILATDGEVGTVDELYFDDETWAVRYLTVETGSWMSGHKVLISPYSIIRIDSQAKQIEVALTRNQVESCEGIDTHLPVSRQQEAKYLSAYGYPHYWEGPYLWGSASYPIGLGVPQSGSGFAVPERVRKGSSDSHLRSTKAITGYHVKTRDGEIGHICGFVLDDHTWALRYIEVATQNWWPGRKVLISPSWVESVSWLNSMVYLALTREAIQSGPQYDEADPIGRDYEDKLYVHYGLVPYWMNEATPRVSFVYGSPRR